MRVNSRCTRLTFSFLLCLAGCLDEEGTADPTPDDYAFPGLSADVEILVDTMGIPHIYAATDEDGAYASGYTMATDRLFQMDLVLRRARGTRAEVMGERFVDDDRLARMIDFPRWGRVDTENMRESSPGDYRMLVAWVAGVNRHIEEVRSGEAPLPYGFGPNELDYLPEPWDIDAPLTVAVLLGFGNDETLQNELLASVLKNQFPELLEAIQILRPMYPVFSVPEENRPRALSAELTPTPRARDPLELRMSRAEAEVALRRFRELMEDFDTAGSNNWAVHGSRTASGRPIVAGDPHQPLESPSLFYAHHLSTRDGGGSFDVLGWSFVGAPGVHIGHNRELVWTATSNFADVVDIWEVQPDPGGVRVGGEVMPVVAREEIIRVRDFAEDGTPLDTYTETMFRARDVGDGYGVLLDDSILPSSLVTVRPTSQLLLRWTGFEGTNMGSSWLAMNRAKTVEELEQAALGLRSGSFNFVTADHDDILYRVGLDVPDRGVPSSRPMPWTVVDGDDPATLWDGTILPPEMMPHAKNPAEGFISTANNDPWGFTGDGVVENDPWYYGSFFAAGYRARRIRDELTRLTTSGGITVEQMQELQLDTHSSLADELLPLLEAAWARVPTDESLADYRDRPELEVLMTSLVDWNRRMDRREPAALTFYLVVMHATARALGDDLDFLFDTVLSANAPYVIKIAVLAMQGAYTDSAAIVEEGPDAVLLAALSDAAALLTARYGSVDPSGYTWGDAHGTYFDNPFGARLNYGFVATDGGEDTVNVSSARFIRGGGVAERFESGSGAIYRMVATFEDDGVPQAHANFPIGNSGDPDSPHWADQVEAWTEGVYRPLPFRRADVEAAMERRIVLSAD